MGEDTKQVNKAYVGNCVIYAPAYEGPDWLGSMSIDNQIKCCESFASDAGYKVVRVFKDVVRKSMLEFEALEPMLGYCCNPSNEVAAIIYVGRERVGPNMGNWTEIVGRLHLQGINFVDICGSSESHVDIRRIFQSCWFGYTGENSKAEHDVVEAADKAFEEAINSNSANPLGRIVGEDRADKTQTSCS